MSTPGRGVGTAHNELESAYRRVLRRFPAAYRADWEDEMVGVLLASAAPGQQRPHRADLADLVRAGIRAWLRHLAALARRDLALVSGVLALLAALTVALLPARPGPAAEAAPTIPGRFADYFGSTGDVSDSPPGRAVALYRHAEDAAFQPLVVGADTDAYRRLDLALSRRTGAESDGEPAPALLSPDGTRVIVGQGLSSRPELVVQELRTGRTRTYRVGAAGGALPLAWSPDGDRIAFVATADQDPATYRTRTPTTGALGLLELPSGRVAGLPGNPHVAAAAFAPGGTELAVQDRPGPGSPGPPAQPQPAGASRLRVVALDGSTVRPVPLPDGEQLAGPAAWSPDGRLLAVTSPQPGAYTRFVAASGGGAAPAPLAHENWGTHHVIGWAAPDRVVVARTGPAETSIVGTGLNGGPTRQLSAIPHGLGHPVSQVQVATALLPTLDIRAPGAPDRGRWPTHWRVGAALGVSLLVFGAGHLLTTRRRVGAATTPGVTAERPAG